MAGLRDKKTGKLLLGEGEGPSKIHPNVFCFEIKLVEVFLVDRLKMTDPVKIYSILEGPGHLHVDEVSIFQCL